MPHGLAATSTWKAFPHHYSLGQNIFSRANHFLSQSEDSRQNWLWLIDYFLSLEMVVINTHTPEWTIFIDFYSLLYRKSPRLEPSRLMLARYQLSGSHRSGLFSMWLLAVGSIPVLVTAGLFSNCILQDVLLFVECEELCRCCPIHHTGLYCYMCYLDTLLESGAQKLGDWGCRVL